MVQDITKAINSLRDVAVSRCRERLEQAAAQGQAADQGQRPKRETSEC